jgi:hypothetical protein
MRRIPVVSRPLLIAAVGRSLRASRAGGGFAPPIAPAAEHIQGHLTVPQVAPEP